VQEKAIQKLKEEFQMPCVIAITIPIPIPMGGTVELAAGTAITVETGEIHKTPKGRDHLVEV
jgi:hypothetical protein